MPRVPQTPADFLPQLEAARAAAKPGTEVNASGLARATGITWRVIEPWVLADDAFPVMRRGGQGNPWAFDLATALDRMIKRARSLSAARGARKAETSRLAGFGGGESAPPSPEPDVGPGSAADRTADARGLKALAEAQMITHRLKQQQREFVPAAAVVALLGDLMTTMQTETLAISSKLDPSGAWPAELRMSVEDELRTVLVIVRDKLDRWLKDWGKGGDA